MNCIIIAFKELFVKDVKYITMKNKKIIFIAITIIIVVTLASFIYSSYNKVQDTKVLTPEEYAKKHS